MVKILVDLQSSGVLLKKDTLLRIRVSNAYWVQAVDSDGNIHIIEWKYCELVGCRP